MLLRLEEGSHVKLGENAAFHLQKFRAPEQTGGRFKGFLDVLKGAFRFTTTLLSKNKRRDLDIRIVTVTAGIRGTDLWGKAAPDRDFLVLIEGEISVQRGNEAAITMAEPLTLFNAPKDAPADPVRPVDPEQLARWAEETELQAGEGVLGIDGPFRVNLQSHRESAFAREARDRLNAAGYPAVLEEVVVDSQAWFRLTVGGFASATDARSFAGDMQGKFGIEGAWVSGI